MKKTLLFFAHSNNDIDHYLPIISTNKDFEILIFFCPDENTVNINNLHSEILFKNKIKIIKIEDTFQNALLRILFFSFQKLKLLKINYTKKNITSILLFYITKIIEKIFNYMVFKNKLNFFFLNLIKKKKIDLIILDIQTQNYNDASSLFRKSLGSLLFSAETLSVPTFMISHGVNIVFHDKKYAVSNNKKKYQSDKLALCNNFETFLYKNLAKSKKNILNLGDVRFDSFWISYLKKINLDKINNLAKKNSKLKILYVLGNMSFLPSKVERAINDNILKLLHEFTEIEMWVKIHPRTNINFNYKHKNLKIFNQDIDTSILIQASDIVITTLSGVLTEAILSDKLSILYQSWKNYLSNPWTIFDKTNCVKKVKNYEELKKHITSYNKNYKIDFKEKNNYFKDFISGGKDINQSITQGYLKEIKNIVGGTN